MNHVQTILSDFRGIARLCGPTAALRWGSSIARHASEIRARRNLQPADDAMGRGPFRVQHPSCAQPFLVSGLFTGIREMYVRDGYLGGGLLKIRDGDVVVDLGANVGNFTTLALAHGPQVRVIAVEPNSMLNRSFDTSLRNNSGFRERVELVRAFVGGDVEVLKGLATDENYHGAPRLTEPEFVQRTGLTSIDFLKCDIEGGEFGLLDGDSALLGMARQVAVEVHAFAGDVKAFLDNVKRHGFEILTVKWDPDGSCTALAKRH